MRSRGLLLAALAAVAVMATVLVLRDDDSCPATDAEDRVVGPRETSTRESAPTLAVPDDVSRVGADVDLDAVDQSSSIVGVVETAYQEHLGGARVEVFDADDDFRSGAGIKTSREPRAVLKTDRDGDFALSVAAHEAVWFRVSARGYARSCFGPFRAGSQHRLELVRPNAVHVTVVDPQRNPVRDAHVRVFGWMSPVRWYLDFGTTDTRGNVVFQRVPYLQRLSVNLVTTWPTWIAPRTRAQRMQRNNVTPWRIRLQKAATRSGTIRSKDSGAPIAEAQISLDRNWYDFVVSDAEGRFALKMTPPEARMGFLRVFARAPGYVGASVHTLGLGDIDIALDVGQRITGRVLGPDGAPVPQARVSANLRGVTTGRPGRRDGNFCFQQTRTDVNGRFVLDSLPGSYRHVIHIEAAELARVDTRLDPTPAGESIDMGDVSLSTSRTLTGVWETENGVPIKHAPISLHAKGDAGVRRHPMHFEQGITDAQGRFQFAGISAGQYVLNARLPDVRLCQNESHDVEIAASVAPTHVKIVSYNVRGLTVRVEAEDGTPIAKAAIVVPGTGSKALMETVTDASGQARMLATTAVTRIVVTPREGETYAYVPPRAVGANETDITITLVRAEETTGTAVDKEGKPVAQAAISIERDGKRVRSIFTENDGSFAIRLAPADVVDLLLVKEFHRDADRQTLYAQARDVSAGSKNVLLRAQPKSTTQSLTVRVVAPDGSVVPQVPIRLDPSPAAKQPRWRTDANGVVDFTDLPGVPTRVEAFFYTTLSRPWCAPDPTTVVPQGQTVDLLLTAGQTIKGRVVDASDKAVSGGVLYVKNNGQLVSSSRVSYKGEFVIAVNERIETTLEIRYVGPRRAPVVVRTMPDAGELTIRSR